VRPYGFVHLEGLEDARHDARLAQAQPEGLWRRRMEPYVGRVARRRAGVLERVLCRCRVPVGSEGVVVSTWMASACCAAAAYLSPSSATEFSACT